MIRIEGSQCRQCLFLLHGHQRTNVLIFTYNHFSAHSFHLIFFFHCTFWLVCVCVPMFFNWGITGLALCSRRFSSLQFSWSLAAFTIWVDGFIYCLKEGHSWLVVHFFCHCSDSLKHNVNLYFHILIFSVSAFLPLTCPFVVSVSHLHNSSSFCPLLPPHPSPSLCFPP